MPIYEYQCQECGKTCDFFEKNINAPQSHKCPGCGSRKLKKLISGFSAGKSGQASSGNDSCPTGTCPFS